ncbi:MBL fold metallo-hydrolase [Corynebacterium heidelbergense]|uniref:Zn-dependent hydrolase n=1 Tax=Corynebacterium heidelbergense TaxID=2055947 RepID=A0A364V9A1_9CORY|nr:MBL fold metallo-hydrolase [Corynebacterium heidelbergense]RAV33194.1 Zn-dependent hydrolase [Corynebacterium heidelbergense]WCZ36282.1 putative metallo-hydrolase [Corynebacterium heidelbergense]
MADTRSHPPQSATGLRIDRVVTHGIFALDGGEWEVDNNIWVLGDDEQCVIIDAAHEAAPIAAAVADREVLGVLCSHAHNDHITVAPELARRFDSRVFVHPGDRMLWDETHPDVEPFDLADGDTFSIAGTQMQVMNTPGHSPGSCAFYLPEAKVLFSGDTLFAGGPGATGRSFSDFGTIIESIKQRLLTLPNDTEVYTGHGDATQIGEEAPHLEEWIARGH